jgi:mannose-1-phosphate guanylyltransferase/phosphomannomutase
MVMRTMLESVASEDVVLVDGVKVLEEDGWALIVPDPQEPWTHVWAEGQSDVEARARAHEYTVRIRRVLH